MKTISKDSNQKGSLALEEGVAEGFALLIDVTLLKAGLEAQENFFCISNFQSHNFGSLGSVGF